MAPSAQRKGASEATALHQRRVREDIERLASPDDERASRGLLAAVTGHAVSDPAAYAFVDDPAALDAPDTVNPSLWRQARLNGHAGLFEVTKGVYQVRGLDLSNITFIAGDTGWVVIDPLTTSETASAAFALVTEHLGARAVRAVIYTHSHVDHYGGVLGVVERAAIESGAVPVIAPAGFLLAAAGEQVIAGNAMVRRASYMYGVLLARDPRGHVDTGLGRGLAMGTSELVAPTREITATGESVILDGVRLVFHLTPGTEAPAEMNIVLPDRRALCVAENCTANQHNLYTLRGAPVRDALQWSKYIDEVIERFSDDCDVLFASHHWPRFGHDDAVGYLASQRDAYRFIHDQTMRLANHGYTMNEIAERLELPAALGDEFFNRGYYGTISHNAKAVYQRYLGWFDANPAHLQPHPPAEAARRYVEYMGGADAVLERATRSMHEGDYRWVAEVLNHVIFADPGHEAARLLAADALEQLGYQAESGPWRDFYLTGALELRANGTPLAGLARGGLAPGIVRALSPEQLLDLIGVRVDGERAAARAWRFAVRFSDHDELWCVELARGVLHARRGTCAGDVDASITTSAEAFAEFASGVETLRGLAARGAIEVDGDLASLDAWAALLDDFDLGFEIVLP